LKTKNSLHLLILFLCALPLSACNKSELVALKEQNVEIKDEAIEAEAQKVKNAKTETTETTKSEAIEKEPEVVKQSSAGFDVKMKSGTKTLKGSVDVGHEHEDLLHIDIKPDATASLFQPDLFGPEKLMVIQVINPGSMYEYFIVRLDEDNLKVDKSFKTFNSEPEIVKKPKNGQFTVAFQEAFPDSGARTIAPCVALNYKKGQLILDTKEMQKRGSEAELGNAQSIKAAFEVHQDSADSSDVPAELTDEIVSRYYLGKAKEARTLFNQSWPKGRKGKAQAWSHIMDQLKESPYWSQIKAMNKL